MKHEASDMERVRPLQANCVYVGKGWKALFKCDCCGKETWQHLNFLGQKVLVCNGEKIKKEAR